MAILLTGTGKPQQTLAGLWGMAETFLATADRVSLWIDHPCQAGELLLPPGITPQVHCPPTPLGSAEERIAWLEAVFQLASPDLLLLPANHSGHELGTRLSARLGCGFYPNLHALSATPEGLVVGSSTCGSHLDWHRRIERFPAIATITPTKGTFAGSIQPEFSPVPLSESPTARQILSVRQLAVPVENPLETAPILFVGGRGLGAEGCQRLRIVAAKFGAVPGFTRPVAMSGWCALDEIVGQSGVRAAPDLCVAVGVSGAAAFLAGIRGVKTLIAVNTDENAPIFRHADVGMIADGIEILAQLDR